MKKYIVMECRLSYAVVLDENGQFLKVANRHYEVGQTVSDVIEMQVPQKKKTNRWVYSLATMAACMVMIVTSVFQMGRITYASVYMTINPEVRIDVNRKDVVVGLEGINEDGENLIEGYDYKRKNLNLVMDELLDRAIAMEYLHEGGQISLVLDTESNEWILSHSDMLTVHLNDYLSEKLTVTIDVTDTKTKKSQITIPITPDESNSRELDHKESDYEESDYGTIKSDIQSSVNNATNDRDYDDSNYDDSQTDYDSPGGKSDYDSPSASDKSSNYDAKTDEDSDTDYDIVEKEEIDDVSDYDDKEESNDESDYQNSDYE